jgi:hypothetical protein
MAIFAFPILSFASSILLVASAIIAEPIITRPPDLSKRQATSTAGWLIGYIYLGGDCQYMNHIHEYETANTVFYLVGSPYYCPTPDETFSEWESWGRCCSTEYQGCDFLTACEGSTIYGEVGTLTWYESLLGGMCDCTEVSSLFIGASTVVHPLAVQYSSTII